MKKIIISFLFSLIFIVNINAQIKYHIYGTIDRTDTEKIYIGSNSSTLIDSAFVNDGTFEMKGVYQSPEVVFIMIKTLLSDNKLLLIKMILDNGEYHAVIDAKMKVKIISTSINHNLWMNWLTSDEVKANKNAKDSLLRDYSLQIEEGNYNLSEQYLAKYNDIKLNLLNYYKKLVNDNSDCYIIPYLLKGTDLLTLENFGASFDQLSLAVRNNEWGPKFKATLENKKTTNPDKYQLKIKMLGSFGNSFESKQVNGKNFTLSSLKGKWVLLDFWASWCMPCRAELPELVKAYEKFRNKDFVISYVSIDNSTSDWLKALLEDKTPPFIHSKIAEFGKSEAYKYYQVNAIPANFLINPEGRIVDVDLRGDELLNKLARVIK